MCLCQRVRVEVLPVGLYFIQNFDGSFGSADLAGEEVLHEAFLEALQTILFFSRVVNLLINRR